MKPTYFLAVDIGASSGRHILGHLEDGRMILEEIYRFPNGMVKKDGHLVWEIDHIVEHVKTGMRLCKEQGKTPAFMGIDTWGVDFVLLDKDGNRLGDAVGYRDHRTEGMDDVVRRTLPDEELYARTGIQKQIFNTVYQLTALRESSPELLEKAESFLMIPDYLAYCLTGKKSNEYTNATTGQLVNAETCDWDFSMMERLGIPTKLFSPLSMPGTVLGTLSPEVEKEVGYSLSVMLPATHDTGSAVLAVPTNSDDIIYISSGTWSLMGVERMQADTSARSGRHNFTNEGGYDRRFRYLKNIMGLWMIQSIKKELKDYSFPEIAALAAKGTPKTIDVNDLRFLAPESMLAAVREVAGDRDLSVEDVLASVYHGLADCYAKTVREIEEITGKTYSAIHIIGGGCRDDFLSHLTREKSGKPVFAGPVEATAIGNITAQMLGQKIFASIPEAREAIAASFDVAEKF